MRADLFFESMLTPINSKMLSWEMPQLSLLIDCLFITGEIHDCKYKATILVITRYITEYWMKCGIIEEMSGGIFIFLYYTNRQPRRKCLI